MGARRLNPQTNFYGFPDIPSGYPMLPNWSIVIPINEDVTNLVINPSFETNTTNWTGGSCANISRVTADSNGNYRQYFGAYCVQVTCSFPPSSPRQLIYGAATPLSLTAGVSYAGSAMFISSLAGLTYDFYVATTTGVRISGRRFRSTGFWQRIWFPYTETSTTSRRLYIDSVDPLQSVNTTIKDFFVDGVQFEAIPTGQLIYPTTYIDGDRIGITPNEFPIPYYWNGTPHASTSVRSGATRSGGRIINLRDLGLDIAAVSGLGLTTPQHTSLPYGQLDGEVYQRTQKNARVFSIAGRLTGRSLVQLDNLFAGLSNEVDSDSGPRREPLVMKYQPMDEEEIQTGPELDMIVTYDGGLESTRDNMNSEIFSLNFKQYSPTLLGHTEGVALTANVSVSNAGGVIKRTSNDVWSALGTGTLGAVLAMAQGLDGTIYAGGSFSDAGGTGAQFAAKYNILTDTWSPIQSGGLTDFNADVRAIAVGPDGRIYFGGDFTNVDGIANADGIVVYNPNTDTFAALGTGTNAGGDVYALDFDSLGNLYAGGNFTSMGGVANTDGMARWDGSAWNAMGTGFSGGAAIVMAIEVIGSNVFVGGNFPEMGGVSGTARLARWSIISSTWNAMSTGANIDVYALRGAPNGDLYIGGLFTTLGTVTANYLGRWNGVSFFPVGSPTAITHTIAASVRAIASDRNGVMYIGGDISAINGIALSDSMVLWDGGSFTPLGVDSPGDRVHCLFVTSNGMLFASNAGLGSATAQANTTVTHSGSARTYPTVVIKGPSSGSSRVRMIKNITTKKQIFFNYTIFSGETATLILDPVRLSLRSDFQNNISNLVMSGSSEADFFLIKGDNIISVLIDGSPTALYMFWNESFLSVHDATGKV